jgi:hypothetical protein
MYVSKIADRISEENEKKEIKKQLNAANIFKGLKIQAANKKENVKGSTVGNHRIDKRLEITPMLIIIILDIKKTSRYHVMNQEEISCISLL